MQACGMRAMPMEDRHRQGQANSWEDWHMQRSAATVTRSPPPPPSQSRTSDVVQECFWQSEPHSMADDDEQHLHRERLRAPPSVSSLYSPGTVMSRVETSYADPC